MNTCAVIGAGAAGLAAARALQTSGVAVTVFDKGRKPGGRVARRDTDYGTFDHGAQCLRIEQGAQAFDPAIPQAHTVTWCAAAAVNAPAPLIGVPSMSRMVDDWCTDITLHLQRRVVSLQRDAGRWLVQFEGDAQPQGFDAVVVTVPSPQLAPLLPNLILPALLTHIIYDPCWTLLWVPSAPTLPTRELLHQADTGCIAWMCREDLKPGRTGTARYTAHATAAWSSSSLEWAADAVRERLLVAAAELAGVAPGNHYAAVHRWRYARVRRSAGAAQLQLAPGLHYASDGCLGDSIAAAIASGRAAAAALLPQLR